MVVLTTPAVTETVWMPSSLRRDILANGTCVHTADLQAPARILPLPALAIPASAPTVITSTAPTALSPLNSKSHGPSVEQLQSSETNHLPGISRHIYRVY
jgi:hypothetical protein